MARDVEIVAVENEDLNIRLYVLALIALARQIQAEELAANQDSEKSVETTHLPEAGR